MTQRIIDTTARVISETPSPHRQEQINRRRRRNPAALDGIARDAMRDYARLHRRELEEIQPYVAAVARLCSRVIAGGL